MNTSQMHRLKIKNFRSFYEEQSIEFGDYNSPRTVTAVYGPNASGKSNIAHALRFIQFFIVNSNNAELTNIPIQPFKLKVGSVLEPSSFEIEFTQKSRRIIYGFSVTAEKIHREYLKEYASSTNKPRLIFERKDNKLNPTAERYGFGKRLFESTRSTSLLVTKARENNNSYANLVFSWASNTNILLGTNIDETMQWSIQQYKIEPSIYDAALVLLKESDLWIRSFNIVESEIPLDVINQLPLDEQSKANLRASRGASNILTTHALRDKKQKIVGEQSLDLNGEESSGTIKMFSLAVPIIDTLKNGKTLYIDEFSAFLHPDMCRFIVALFKSSRNDKNAQLIVNAHDTSLMSADGVLEREDIIFVEKNYAEESVVVPLKSKSPRADESFEKRYRQGLYGAKPQIYFEG